MPGYPDVTITYVVCVHGWRQAAIANKTCHISNMYNRIISNIQVNKHNLKHVQQDHLEYSSQ